MTDNEEEEMNLNRNRNVFQINRNQAGNQNQNPNPNQNPGLNRNDQGGQGRPNPRAPNNQPPNPIVYTDIRNNAQNIQNQFWQSLSLKTKSYCKICGAVAHTSPNDCPRRCKHCRGNHDSNECPTVILCPWCGKTAGNHICDAANLNYPRLKLRCGVCKTRGHSALECNANYLALARIANTIKSLIKSTKRRNPKRKTRRFRGLGQRRRKNQN